MQQLSSLILKKKNLEEVFLFFFSLNFLFPWQLKPANVHQKPCLNETIRPKLCTKTNRVDTNFYVSTRQSKCLWWTVFSFDIMYVVSQLTCLPTGVHVIGGATIQHDWWTKTSKRHMHFCWKIQLSFHLWPQKCVKINKKENAFISQNKLKALFW